MGTYAHADSQTDNVYTTSILAGLISPDIARDIATEYLDAVAIIEKRIEERKPKDLAEKLDLKPGDHFKSLIGDDEYVVAGPVGSLKAFHIESGNKFGIADFSLSYYEKVA